MSLMYVSGIFKLYIVVYCFSFYFILIINVIILNIVRVICFLVPVVLLSSFCVTVLSDFVQGRACIDTKPPSV